MENGGHDREEVRRVLGQFYDSHDDGVKELTVKHFGKMGEYIIFSKIVLFGMHTHLTKMLDSKLFSSDMHHKVAKDTPDLILCQALHFLYYGSNQDHDFDVHVYSCLTLSWTREALFN